MTKRYPLPRAQDDARFSMGLLIEVASVLQEHGYPPIVDGDDLVDLQQALFGFLYERTESTR